MMRMFVRKNETFAVEGVLTRPLGQTITITITITITTRRRMAQLCPTSKEVQVLDRSFQGNAAIQVVPVLGQLRRRQSMLMW